jgi:hypothetical protein
MTAKEQPASLQQLIRKIDRAAQGNEHISWGMIMESLGQASFGPMLVVAGLITLAPIVGDIPGVPTIIAAIVLLTAGQLLLGRSHLWLPHWLLNRSISRRKLHTALRWSYPAARFIDRFLRDRMEIFSRGIAQYVIAFFCIIISLMMPLMEVVPFTANGAGLVLTTFGLALVARDGLMSLLALLLSTATVAIAIYALL